MATNKDIIAAIESLPKEFLNGKGIEVVRADIRLLKEKVDILSEDVKGIKDAGFHDDESLKARLVLLEKSVENIKQYELVPIREKLESYFEQKANNRNTLYIRVIGAVLVAVAVYILAEVFGIRT